MKKIQLYIMSVVAGLMLSACTDLTEHVFDKLDAGIFYQNESSVQGAVAAIYNDAAYTIPEYFWYLQEFSADQIVWRSWNGGQWGYDEAEKYVLSTHTWTSESKIIRSAWEGSWKVIGLSNQLISDLSNLKAADLGMTDEQIATYVAEARMLRAWSYYNLFEVWGGALPLNIKVTTEVPGSADPDFSVSCKKIYDFIMTELDESLNNLIIEDGSNNARNRMNQGVNRILKARLLLNAQLFIGEDHYAECEALCKQILAGDYGTYSLAANYQDIYDINNSTCPEVVFAFAFDVNYLNATNNRTTPFLPYNYDEYFNGANVNAGWNCTCLAPSWDNTGNVQPLGGTDNPKSFLTDYGDKLGAVYERFDDRDIRKQNFTWDYTTGKYKGIFLKGAMRADYNTTTTALKADADRDGQDLVYVDQIGTFLNLGKNLEPVMTPLWGETNSGVRLVKYPVYPASAGVDYRDIDEVEFRLAEVYYMIAECEMRVGNTAEAKSYVDQVRQRYFTDASALSVPGPGFSAFDMDWMLSQWGLEFLNEGNRRRTDLRRFDKFTQGQWWFFGRVNETVPTPEKRDRKYEWFPLPANALLVNPGLKQNPNYL